MGEMEKAFYDEPSRSHEAITKAMENLRKMGYLVKSINYNYSLLSIECYCPQVNEGSSEVKT